MKAQIYYKYRGLDSWEYFLDILVHNRLYAAKFTTLNDPMEGVFTYSSDSTSPSFIDQMLMSKMQLGICSLSKTHNNTLMWAYYGGSHKGVVFGLEIAPENVDILSIEPIKYARDNVFRGFLGSNAEVEARKILSKKLSAWRHEQEVRVFSRGAFVKIKLRSVHFGCQMESSRKQLVRELITKINPEVEIWELRRQDLDKQLRKRAV